MRDSITEMRLAMGFNPLGLCPAKHRVHSVSSRSLEKLHFLAYAMHDKKDKNISNGSIQQITSTYGFVRFGCTKKYYDPMDFRPYWQGEWDEPLNTPQKRLLSIILQIFRDMPSELSFDADGCVDVNSLIHYMNQLPDGAIHPYTLDKIVFKTHPRRLFYCDQKKRIRLAHEHDSFTIRGKEARTLPSNMLYHATPLKNVCSIDCEGIYPIGAPFVSLAENADEARSYFPSEKVFVYQVQTAEMVREGYRFYKMESGGWITSVVPLEFLRYA